MRQPLYWLLTMLVSPLILRLHAAGRTGVVDDWTRAVLLQLVVDVPHQVAVCDLGLLDKPFLELGVAIADVVALRAAAVILEELLVGVVDTAAGIVEPDLVVLAGEPGEPVRGLDRVELAADPDLLELVDQDDRRVAICGDVARGDLFEAYPLDPVRCSLIGGCCSGTRSSMAAPRACSGR
jgi:hypothetical protein